MKLNTGRVAFPIEFDNGDKEVIYFNPNDVSLAERIKQMHANLAKKAEEIDKNKKENATESDYLDMLAKLNQEIKEEFDKAFEFEISKVVFKYSSPLARIENKFYASYVMEEIDKEIQKQNEKQIKKYEKHIGKYN